MIDVLYGIGFTVGAVVFLWITVKMCQLPDDDDDWFS